ncbi:SET domain-containing protein-lysine N-methyltransferase [uncultured Piscinibacter sp.]|uniref:SET domain-containing protein n=1 Tax=uncultured Piscinibacter sp. TaxID=1131835 RepID=UPI002632D406|nr:SET domain-containing protein-lysine N-methyltransferase [uncultured Piscinibacter sp.]
MKAQATNGKSHPAAQATGGRRIQVRRSGVHGKGVFALKPLKKGEVIIEYKGEVIDWPEALRRHPHDPKDPDHTFYFHIDDGNVIDAKHGGNAARWINHACEPNCEADEIDGRVFIKALRNIKPGEELFYDYGLIIDEKYTAKLKKQFACHCGSKKCRGTMLARKR